MFNQNSGLVKIWLRNVNNGTISFDQVPKLSNLQEIIYSVLDVSF